MRGATKSGFALLHRIRVRGAYSPLSKSQYNGALRNLSEAELRYEAVQTLAYGGRGLIWFTHWKPTKNPSFDWKHSIIDGDGTRDDHYDLVQKVNRELQVFGAPLLGATSLSVFHDSVIPPGGAARR